MTMIQNHSSIHGIRVKFEFHENKYQSKRVLFVRAFGIMTEDEHDTIRTMSLNIITLMKYDIIFFDTRLLMLIDYCGAQDF